MEETRKRLEEHVRIVGDSEAAAAESDELRKILEELVEENEGLKAEAMAVAAQRKYEFQSELLASFLNIFVPSF